MSVIRIRAATDSQPTPAKPKSILLRAWATATAISREASYASLAPITLMGHRLPSPTVGRTSLVLANAVVLIVLCFYRLDTTDRWEFENIGYRTGWVTVCQLPLLFLLAGKNNVVGWLTGSSYERLNWLHRWAARCLLLTATIHMGFWFANWMPYDYVGTKVRTDPLTQRGLIAWAILVWISVSSVAPIRGWSYEVFVLQHLVSFAAFIGMVMIHTPKDVHIYIWLCVGLFFFDRLLRMGTTIHANLAIFHTSRRPSDTGSRLWACEADFVPMPNNTTRITIHNPPIHWRAGQHAFLSCHSIVPLQSHPFTISSLPDDGKMEFYVKAGKGGTKRFFDHAEKHSLLPTAHDKGPSVRAVAIEGPYGRLRPLRQFDSVVLIAGSTGATFTVPLFRDIVRSWQRAEEKKPSRMWQPSNGVVTRHVRFIWVVRSRAQLGLFAKQLEAAREDVERLRSGKAEFEVEVDIRFYITCDDDYAGESKSTQNSAPSNGCMEVLEQPASSATVDEKKQCAQPTADVEEISVIPSSLPSRKPKGCRSDGSCCCKTVVSDDDDPSAIPVCNCGPAAPPQPEIQESSKSSLSSSSSSKGPDSTTTTAAANPSSPPSIPLLTGRPDPRSIIRKALEQARGESAVVVCGPAGMVRDVRQSVVGLSDERAVHKGTGAQGVWLHAEAFGY